MEDFNEAKRSDVIPQGTVATVQLTVRPGGAGEGGWLKRASNGNSEGLDCEFVLLDGQYAKRKFWTTFTLNGTTENHAEAGRISRTTIRAMLESARGIKPNDTSEEAKKARTIENFGALNGLQFMARIGVEPAKDNYDAKNKLAGVVTPGSPAWHKTEQLPPDQTGAATAAPAAPTIAAPANAIGRPKWAGSTQSPSQSS